MIVFLFLLGVALTITIAGLLLSSPGKNVSHQQEISYIGHGSEDRRARRRSYAGQRAPFRNTIETVPSRGRGYAPRQESRPLRNALPARNASGHLSVRSGQQTPWMGIILVLLALFIVLYFVREHALHPTLVFNALPRAAPASTPAPVTKNATSSVLLGTSGASRALIRLDQLSAGQYANQQEYTQWSYSACSAAAMTEVINAYKHHYRITDILKVESGLHEITPELGLLEPKGIDRTVDQFGFKTLWFNQPSLDQIISFANQGHPVIVSFPPDRWDGGHLLVVRGGNKDSVYLADSSRLNMQIMSRSTFMKYWVGFAVAAMPK